MEQKKNSKTDQDLVGLYLTEDNEDALFELFERHDADIYNAILKKVRFNEDLAQRFLQEGLVKVQDAFDTGAYTVPIPEHMKNICLADIPDIEKKDVPPSPPEVSIAMDEVSIDMDESPLQIMRKSLIRDLDEIRSGKIKPDAAKAISGHVQSVINLTKLEIQHQKLMGQDKENYLLKPKQLKAPNEEA